MDAFRAIRDAIPAAASGTYLDSAATSPLPRHVIDAVTASLRARAERGEGFFDAAIERADAVRGVVADHLGVDAAGVAFMKNTGEGISHVAQMLPFKRGQNIVTTGLEFPTNRLPWERLARRGVSLRVVAPDDDGLGVTPEALAEHVDEDTALVTAAWVTFNTGYRHDVAAFGRIAHEHGAHMLVDGIQGLGAVVPPDMRHIDFWATGGHKWLMAPLGVGFLYVRPSLVPGLEPDHVGWFGLADWEDYDATELALADTARRFETGNLAFDLISGLGAALERAPSMRESEARIRGLTERLMEGLGPLGRLGTPREPARRAGIVRFLPKDPAAAHARLLAAGVVCSLRTGGVRFSPHHWNDEGDVDRALAAVRAAR